MMWSILLVKTDSWKNRPIIFSDRNHLFAKPQVVDIDTMIGKDRKNDKIIIYMYFKHIESSFTKFI